MKMKVLIFFIPIILVISFINSFALEDYYWIKGDTTWRLNQSIPGIYCKGFCGNDKFVTYSNDSYIRIWDIETGHLITSYKPVDYYYGINLSLDGNYCVGSNKTSEGYQLTLIDLLTGTKLNSILLPNEFLNAEFRNISNIGPTDFVLIDDLNNKIIIGISGVETSGNNEIMTVTERGIIIVCERNAKNIDTNNCINKQHTIKSIKSINDLYLNLISRSCDINKGRPVNCRTNNYITILNTLINKFNDVLTPQSAINDKLNDFFPYYNSNNIIISYVNTKNSQIDYYNSNILDKSNYKLFSQNGSFFPFFLTSNNQYMVVVKQTHLIGDSLLLFNYLSNTTEFSISGEVNYGVNNLVYNEKKNLILHQINNANGSLIYIVDINSFLKPEGIITSTDTAYVGDLIRARIFYKTQPKEITWLIDNIKSDYNTESVQFYANKTGILSLKADILDSNNIIKNLSKNIVVIEKKDTINSVKNYEIDDFKIFYYLNDGIINITFDLSFDKTNNFIRIYNVMGYLVNEICMNSFGIIKIDISNLSPGMYFIKIGNKVEKFVKK